MQNNTRKQSRIRRHKRVRAVIKGTSERPRLSVFRSNIGISVQLIDDTLGRTAASANSFELEKKKSKDKRVSIGESVGELIAKKAREKKIVQVVFDRGGYKYHGIVKAVAEGARKGGLKF